MIGKIKALLGEWTQTLLSRFNRLAPRERWITGGAIGALLLILASGTSLWSKSQSHLLRRQLEDKRLKLAQIVALEDQYREKSRETRELENRLRLNKNTDLEGFLEETGRRFNFEFKSIKQSEKKDKLIKEETLEFKLEKVTLDRLTEFLYQLERSGKLLKVTKLEIKQNHADITVLDADITLALYKEGTPS